jgi:hypothetical protein
MLAVVAIALIAAHPSARAGLSLDLTVPNSQYQETSSSGSQFIVSYSAIQPTGTGNIDPFLRVQATNSDQEQGFNTDVGTPLDDKGGPWTHSVQVGELGSQTIGGVQYAKFLLDANQVGDGPVSLNQVQFFLSSSDLGSGSFNVTGPSSTTNAVISFPGATQVFQMSASATSGTGYEVQVASGHGSGQGDLFLYVPIALFGSDNNAYVTMFTQLGDPPATTNATNDGFEEWSVLGGGHVLPTPEPTTIIPALMGLVPLAWVGVRRYRRRSEEVGPA